MARYADVTLPSGTVVQLCDECSHRPPRHQFCCSAVRCYNRIQIFDELLLCMLLEDRLERDLAVAAAATVGMIGDDPTVRRAAGMLMEVRCEFWDWAHWLGFDFWKSTEHDRDNLRADVVIHARRRVKGAA